MIVLTSFPVRNLNDNVALPSRWSSVNQPILFSACRQDQSVINVRYVGGVWQVLLTGVPYAAAVGGKIWLKSGTNDQQVTISSITGQTLVVAGSGLVQSTGGYVNYLTGRPAYYVELNVFGVSASNTYELIGTHEVKPSPDGRFTFDLHGYLLQEQRLGDEFGYDVINEKQPYAGSRYNFSYTEVWTGSSSKSSALSSTTQFYWSRGIKQLQEQYNFNVAQHVLFPSVNTTKFLSGFRKPTYFPGFPFSLSFIYSDRVAGYQLQRVEDNLSDPVTTANLDPAQGLFVNQMKIAGSYPANVSEIDVWLNSAGAVALLYVDSGYVSNYVSEVPALPEVRVR